MHCKGHAGSGVSPLRCPHSLPQPTHDLRDQEGPELPLLMPDVCDGCRGADPQSPQQGRGSSTPLCVVHEPQDTNASSRFRSSGRRMMSLV